MRYTNPNNDYTEELGWETTVFAVLLGPFWLLIKGAVGPAMAWAALVALAVWLVPTSMFKVLAFVLIWTLFTAFSNTLVATMLQRQGLKERT